MAVAIIIDHVNFAVSVKSGTNLTYVNETSNDHVNRYELVSWDQPTKNNLIGYHILAIKPIRVDFRLIINNSSVHSNAVNGTIISFY